MEERKKLLFGLLDELTEFYQWGEAVSQPGVTRLWKGKETLEAAYPRTELLGLRSCP
jgi:hypothetical protein